MLTEHDSVLGTNKMCAPADLKVSLGDTVLPRLAGEEVWNEKPRPCRAGQDSVLKNPTRSVQGTMGTHWDNSLLQGCGRGCIRFLGRP